MAVVKIGGLIYKIGISIVTLDRPHILKATLDALSAHGLKADVIVDNGSKDPETLQILRMCDATTVFSNETNLGLSRAINQGLAQLYEQGFDVLVHLDDDAVIQNSQSIGDLAAAIERAPELGLAIPNGQNYIEFLPGKGYRELRWGLGFVWALRRSLYEEIGGYDPGLMHQQECDLGLRVRMAGFHVGAIESARVHHNDPGGERSDFSKAREHLGCVQFRDKHCAFFRGSGWNYGTMPLYLMQHWPPDQEWYRRYAEHHGIDLNPPPAGLETQAVIPGATLGLSEDALKTIPRSLRLPGGTYMAYVDLRNEYSHWCRGDGYLADRQKAIDRWKELTGEVYGGYRWPNLLKPTDSDQMLSHGGMGEAGVPYLVGERR